MVTYVYRDGKRLTPWMLYQINRLDTDIYREFGVHIIVSDGIRTAQEQLTIWYDRYVTAVNVRGRRVYDTRWWNGQLWYRVSAAGTVAQPTTSNHEIQGTDAAVDIRDTGADAGVTVKSSTRGQWIRRNAAKYDLVAEGDGFGEGWHFKVRNIFNAVPTSGGGSTPATTSQEDDMPVIIVQRKDSSKAKGQMTHNRKMREITRWENIAYRAAQEQNRDAVIYVTVSDSEYANLLAGKD